MHYLKCIRKIYRTYRNTKGRERKCATNYSKPYST